MILGGACPKDAIIRGVLFVPMWTKFLTQIHRDSLSANPAAWPAVGDNGKRPHRFAKALVLLLGAYHAIFQIQADGHSGLDSLPDVHPVLG